MFSAETVVGELCAEPMAFIPAIFLNERIKSMEKSQLDIHSLRAVEGSAISALLLCGILRLKISHKAP